MKSIGFIGLGTMGKPMAANLLRKSFPVVVYNRTPGKADELVALGAEVAASPAEVAKACDVVFTMVSNDDSLEQVIWGDNGILQGIRPGITVIDCSTVSPELSRRAASELARHYVEFLDSPVTGSKPAAIAGTLTFMVGGSRQAVEEHMELFLAMGTTVVHMGESGTGSTTKLAHNTIVGINVAGLAEGMAIAARAGIDPRKFVQIVQSGGAASRMADLKVSKIIEGDYSVQFSLGLMLKDLILSVTLNNRNQLPTPLLETAKNLYQMGLSKGLGDSDLSSVVMCYEDWMRSTIGEAIPADADSSGPDGKEAGGSDRRRNRRVQLGIELQISVYQWLQEGAFSGQTVQGILVDLSENGMQITSEYPLAPDMFIVIHFPMEADLPPITARIIRAESIGELFRYGCLLSGIPPYVRERLEAYITLKVEQQGEPQE